jgi:uncharacterized membrane protein
MNTKSIAPDRYERLLAWGAMLMLAVVTIAVVRGEAHWSRVPAFVWVHLATIMIALVLTPVMLLSPRGTKSHRTLGTIWLAAMFTTAVISFFVRQTNPGHFSWIHLLSLFVIIAVPRALWAAKKHQINAHRTAIRGMVTGSLLIAGLFTFPFGRMLGTWLFGS